MPFSVHLMLLLAGCSGSKTPEGGQTTPPVDTDHSTPDTTPPVDTADTNSTDTADTDSTDTADTDSTESPPVFIGWPQPLIARGPAEHAASLADLNSDGRLDLITCSQVLSWFLNPGEPWLRPLSGDEYQSSWSGEWEALSLQTPCDALSVGDFNNDGVPDIAVRLDNWNRIEIYTGGSTGPELWTSLGPLENTHYNHTMFTGDFDGDGVDDLVSSGSVFWNDGDHFTQEDIDCGEFSPHIDGVAALLSDGRDVISCYDRIWVASSKRVWSWSEADSECDWITGNQGVSQTVDLDGDGHRDALAAWNDLILCTGDGTGQLSPGETLLSSDDVWVSELHDADGDGYVDFVANNEDQHDDGDLSWFQGSADGPVLVERLFLPAELHQKGGALYRDLDGDGVAELLAWDAWSDDFYLFPLREDGSGFHSLLALRPVSGSWNNIQVVAGDFDGDGWQDAVLSNSTGDAERWLGEGERVLTQSAAAVLDGTPIAAWDRDGDGADELLLNRSSGWQVVSWRDEEPTTATINGSVSIADSTLYWTHDLDGDGVEELLVDSIGLDLADPGDNALGHLVVLGNTSSAIEVSGVWSGSVHAVTVLPDINTDGVDELVILTDDGLEFWAWQKGQINRVHTVALSRPADLPPGRALLLSADTDADGNEDLLLAWHGDTDLITLIHDGIGGFSEEARRVLPADLWSSGRRTLQDVDHDGLPELWAIQESDPSRLRFWRVQESGFAEYGFWSSPIEDFSTPQDIDNDGLLDLIGGADKRAWVTWGVEEAPEAGR